MATRQGRPGTQPSRIAECLVGDDSGVMVLTARNDQGEGPFCRLTGGICYLLPPSNISADSPKQQDDYWRRLIWSLHRSQQLRHPW